MNCTYCDILALPTWVVALSLPNKGLVGAQSQAVRVGTTCLWSVPVGKDALPKLIHQRQFYLQNT